MEAMPKPYRGEPVVQVGKVRLEAGSRFMQSNGVRGIEELELVEPYEGTTMWIAEVVAKPWRTDKQGNRLCFKCGTACTSEGERTHRRDYGHAFEPSQNFQLVDFA